MKRSRRGRAALGIGLALPASLHCTVDRDLVARRIQSSALGGAAGAGGGIGGGGALSGAAGTLSGEAGTPSGEAGASGEGGTPSGGAGASGEAGTLSGGAGGMSGGTGGWASGCEAERFIAATPTQDRCAGWAARRSFSHALCSCGDVQVGGVLASATFDSSSDSSSPLAREPRQSAAIGINGNFSMRAFLNVDGSLTIGGDLPLTSSGGIDVAGDLRLAGPASAMGPISVRRDAWLLGTMSSMHLLEIDRDLHVAPGVEVSSFGPVLVRGERFDEPFVIPPPCACAESDRLDVAGIVQDGFSRNDNARDELALDALDNRTVATTLSLSCGRFALQRIGGRGPITLKIVGKVVLLVDGDVDLGREFELELEPSAELDWFVDGNFSLAAGARLGASGRAGALRLYVTGPGDLTLPGTAAVALNLYAPEMNVSVGGLGDFYGAVFAASVSATRTLLVHYDRSVVAADELCSPPAPSCSRCDDCAAGAACIAGACGACSSDADCCSPLVCDGGECKPLGAD